MAESLTPSAKEKITLALENLDLEFLYISTEYNKYERTNFSTLTPFTFSNFQGLILGQTWTGLGFHTSPPFPRTIFRHRPKETPNIPSRYQPKPYRRVAIALPSLSKQNHVTDLHSYPRTLT
jgi:hypothetical protein